MRRRRRRARRGRRWAAGARRASPRPHSGNGIFISLALYCSPTCACLPSLWGVSWGRALLPASVRPRPPGSCPRPPTVPAAPLLLLLLPLPAAACLPAAAAMDGIDDDVFRAELYSTFYHEALEHMARLLSAARVVRAGGALLLAPSAEEPEAPVEQTLKDSVRAPRCSACAYLPRPARRCARLSLVSHSLCFALLLLSSAGARDEGLGVDHAARYARAGT